MNLSRTPCCARLARRYALAFPLATIPLAAFAQAPSADAPAKSLGVVTVNSGQPTSLPTQIPTTIEGITREQIEQTINATDSEDALKYFPSLLVRKRYIGDYNHAILSSRASGTGNSARSAVYADGILLSNYLGNGIANGTNYAPRWGLVTPEEIERVDVLYGPFSAAYPGNSVGAVVDYVTRMPTQFEAHAKAQRFHAGLQALRHRQQLQRQPGQRVAGQPQRRLVVVHQCQPHRQRGPAADLRDAHAERGTAPRPGATVVSGAVPGLNTRNVPWLLLGGATQYETRQEHLKLKVAYDFSSTVRASYTLGYWKNTPKTARRATCAMRRARRCTAATSASTGAATRWRPATLASATRP
jgi:iron complex outermembrane receptor protein